MWHGCWSRQYGSGACPWPSVPTCACVCRRGDCLICLCERGATHVYPAGYAASVRFGRIFLRASLRHMPIPSSAARTMPTSCTWTMTCLTAPNATGHFLCSAINWLLFFGFTMVIYLTGCLPVWFLGRSRKPSHTVFHVMCGLSFFLSFIFSCCFFYGFL